MSKMQKNIVEVDGIPIHYLEAGTGPAIVYLHGAGGAPPEGASFADELAARHRLLIPSRPGFDETPIGACTTIEDVANVIAGFIRARAQGKAHVVAQSAGGAVACWLAALEPGLVETLVLSAPAAFAPAGRRPPPREELDRILYGDTPSWAHPPTPEDQQRIARNAAGNMQRHRGEDPARLLERLGGIKAPTLLLWGTGDRLVPEEAMAPIQERIPNCMRILIYGAAHELPIAATRTWMKLVSDFVDRGEMFVVNKGD